MKNILIALDFHTNSGLLIDQAAALAKPFGAKVWLIHTASTDPDFVGYDAGPQYVRDLLAEELRKEHRMLQELAADLEKSGIAADGLLVNGPTVEILLQEAHQLKADLLVLGFHKNSRLHEFFLGNTTEALIRQTDIPVLVVPLG